MYLKWVGRIAIVAVAFVAAERYASSTVLKRMTAFQETLVAPTGQWITVSRTAGANGPRRLDGARVMAMEEVAFGYRVTYALPTRPSLVCTYRLPGISCEDGWTVFWTQRSKVD